MNSETVRLISINLSNPLDSYQHINVTSRGIKFIVDLFTGRNIDVLDLHYLLLQIAIASGSIDNNKISITLSDLVTFMLMFTPECINQNDILDIANTFTEDKDNKYQEVKNMKKIIRNITL